MMKVLIQYTQTGKYRGQVWESMAMKAKGDLQAVTPSCAAQLIKHNKAKLVTSGDQIIIHP
ncbi:hypothetical protein HLBS07_19640 [Vibrio alginolyticus]|nr:hypothetical protein HLBS07_19640 [Vibrio alginolyticus]